MSRLSISGINLLKNDYNTSSQNVSSNKFSEAILGNPAEEVVKKNSTIENEIVKKQEELASLQERLGYLKGEPELVAKKQKKRKSWKTAGIIGAVAGIGGTLAVTVPGFIASSTTGVVGLGALLGVTLTPLLVGGALALGGALAVAKINSNKNKKEEANKEAEIAQVEQQIQNLQKEISELQNTISS